jgi:hypothetical protein
MSRLHPKQWGERQQLDLRDDWSLGVSKGRNARHNGALWIGIYHDVIRPLPTDPKVQRRLPK